MHTSTLPFRSARTAQTNMTDDNTSSDDDSSEDDQYTDLKTLAAQVDLPNDFWQVNVEKSLCVIK